MADTTMGSFSNAVCICGRKGCVMWRCGPLVPPGKSWYLCLETCRELTDYYHEHGTYKPENEINRHIEGETEAGG